MNLKKICLFLLAAGLAAETVACGSGKEETAEITEQQESAEEPEETAEQQPSGGELPADAGPKGEQAGEEGAEETVQEESEEGTIDNEGRKDQYMSVLLGICTENRLPDGSALSPLEEGSGKMSDNRFAVYDIDGDGKRELLVQYVTAPTAGMMELIYDYEEETKSVREQFREYPLLTFYDNGMIEAGWSHNQGRSGDALWPCTLWQYAPEEDTYHAVAQVEAWDRKITETDPDSGAAFPEETDADGDGVVYYIRPEGEYDYKAPVDGPEYERWRDSYLGGAKTVDLVYEEMTEQNIYMVE